MTTDAGAGFRPAPISDAESAYAWWRLGVAVTLSTLGGVGMWSVVVALPALQSEFGVARAEASLPYTLTMLCFGVGGILIGRLVDRFGVVYPLLGAVIALGVGYVVAAETATLWQFALAQGALIGIASAATFGPLLADVSHWFTRRRGIAIAICAAGNYLAGALWPPIVQHFVTAAGWRHTYIGIGLFCVATMLPLILCLRRPAPAAQASTAGVAAAQRRGLSSSALHALLALAGVACCVAMSMPQVHLVAYCADLGYGVARGAEMLSLMLVCGIASRVASGFIADRIGALATVLLGSALQGLALLLYLAFNGLASLYLISALFGLFQGGIVSSYPLIVRDYFPPEEAGMRVGIVLMATLVGMALGGWLSGAIFDVTGSYRAAFANGVLWNLLNGGLVLSLLLRRRRGLAAA